MPAPVYFHHRSSLRHDTGAHPERAERIVAIERALAEHDWLGVERREAPPVATETLLAVHPEDHVEAVRALCESGGGALDVDTIVSKESFDAAIHAAGGAVALVDALLEGEPDDVRVGFSITRPPGHHAERARAMGFCLFNNVAVAARHALAVHDAERVLVLDWDVHHGNGTNDIFHADPMVLYVSLHQWPLYPGSGPPSDVGHGAGEGYTVNLPVPAGSGDDEFCSLVEHVVVPLAREYRPGLILLSAGFDAHREDPLADCLVTDAGYASMATGVRGAAEALGAPVGVLLEGGYALDALARSFVATARALEGGGRNEVVEPAVHELSRAAARRLAPRWPALAAIAEG